MKVSEKIQMHKFSWAALGMLVFAAAGYYWPPPRVLAADQFLLDGRVTSSDKTALAGIPVRAHRENSSITVSVYTNSRGAYSFPAWSDVTPGSYSLAIELPDFEPMKRDGVTLSAGKTAHLDLTVQP